MASRDESGSVRGLNRGQQDDIVIAVMGSTGTGKSSFIKLLTGTASVKVGNSLESETSDVQVVRFLDPTTGRNVIIVDTPGFDDSRAGVTDTDILKKITDFLLTMYDKDRKLNGLIYVQRISDPRFSGQSSRNLRMFRNLCGTKAYQNVVVLTTFWDRVASQQEAVEREEQLKTKFFKDLVDGGARFMRYDRNIESARQVLGHILTLVPTNVQIQEEIRLEGKTLEDTAAGSVRREEVEQIIAKHKQEVAALKEEMEGLRENNKATRRELEEERVKLQQELVRWETERVELKKGLDEAREVRERLEADVAKERDKREKWRQEQEREWNSRLEEFQRKQGQLNQEKERKQVKKRGPRVTERNPPPWQSEFQFTGSDKYPPYMKNIPKKYQLGVFDIFNFTSLLETTAMLFVQPELVAKLRNLAPDAKKINSMQDLEDRNRQLYLKSQQDSRAARDMYSSKNIGLRDDWYTDAAFGQQQFTGTNSTTITLAPRRWFDGFKTASQAQQRADVTRLLTDDPTSFYIQDYSDFRAAMGVSPNSDLTTEGRYGCASVVLFHLEPEGKLHPLAITIDYKRSMENSVTIFNRRVTSAAPGDESEDWPWRYAKMCAQVSDWLRHEVAIHLVNTHLVEEVIITAAHRMFEPFHIIFKLLEPHWATTLPLNKAARETLVPKIIIGMTGYTPAQSYAFLLDSYDKFDWTGLYVPNDLRRRGFPIEELDKVKYHNYGYARNIACTWAIIRRFVSTVLIDAYPGGDTQIADDSSIAAFCDEVRSPDGGQLTSFPDIDTLDGLIDFVTMCIHIASPQHTAVNYLQQYYQTFVPNKPSALFAPPPQSLEELQSLREKDILTALPIRSTRDWLIMAQVPYLLSFEVPEEGTILHYASTVSDLPSTPEVIRNAARTLKDELEDFIDTVAKHSKELDDQQTPYLVLDPSRTAISILI